MRGIVELLKAVRIPQAVQMRRQGVPLEKIGLVLWHRGVDTTTYDAKGDVALLKQVAQPWPEALWCWTRSRPISPCAAQRDSRCRMRSTC